MTGPSTTGIDARLASVLSYSVWWVTGILFLILERRDRLVRFHAAQAVVLFGSVSLLLALLGASSAVALAVSSQAYPVVRALGNLVWVAGVVLWLVLVVRAWRGDTWRVPLVATLADGLVERTSW
ncbi:MAG TPA: hypothetical protein PLH72_16095 [Vicinamibacterales bacterium]|nr:hypothetical protein [Vicinamibacterales bacterium]